MFTAILNQMVFLFAFIALGFFFAKTKLVPENSAQVLSRLENLLFIPALVLGTFIKNCTLEDLGRMWKLLVMSGGMLALFIPLSLLSARLCFKENYLRKIATYGLAFSNFAYMGNAVMAGVFGEAMFADYLVFCLPLWLGIYLWGVPVLLISGSNEDGEKVKWKDRLKNFLNPMLVCTVIGIALGLSGLGAKLPKSIVSVVDTAGNCMSPVAMLLTGLTVGKLDLKALLSRWRIYVFSAIKLFLFPLVFLAVFAFLPQNAFISRTFLVCGMCVACMPMGLNTIVVPAGYGKDTTDAAGMALVTHILSVGTIPLMFMLFQLIV